MGDCTRGIGLYDTNNREGGLEEGERGAKGRGDRGTKRVHDFGRRRLFWPGRCVFSLWQKACSK
jgi:hypothetical protein